MSKKTKHRSASNSQRQQTQQLFQEESKEGHKEDAYANYSEAYEMLTSVNQRPKQQGPLFFSSPKVESRPGLLRDVKSEAGSDDGEEGGGEEAAGQSKKSKNPKVVPFVEKSSKANGPCRYESVVSN